MLAREGRLGIGLDRRLARHMLAFSLPLVPASVASWTLNLSDRYLIAAFHGPAAVGTYSAGYTVGLAINALAISPFTLAWGAAYWEIAKQDDARAVISRVLTGVHRARLVRRARTWPRSRPTSSASCSRRSSSPAASSPRSAPSPMSCTASSPSSRPG